VKAASTIEEWSRWTLYYYWPDDVDDDDLWSASGTWGDGGVWNSDLTPQEVIDLRLIPKEWNAAHCFGSITLLTPSIELRDYPPGGAWADAGAWLAEDVYPVTISIS
jgi:hypothetical protein